MVRSLGHLPVSLQPAPPGRRAELKRGGRGLDSTIGLPSERHLKARSGIAAWIVFLSTGLSVEALLVVTTVPNVIPYWDWDRPLDMAVLAAPFAFVTAAVFAFRRRFLGNQIGLVAALLTFIWLIETER